MGGIRFFGQPLLKSLSPAVMASQATGGTFDNTRDYYKYTVSREALYEDGQGHYLFLMKSRNDFWLEGFVSRKCYVIPLRENAARVAFEPVETGEYQISDLIICRTTKPLRDGGRVYRAQ